MLNTDDSWLNPSKRAKEYLDQVLEGDNASDDLVVVNKKVLDKESARKAASRNKSVLTDFSVKESDELVGVDEARSEAPVLEQVSDRQKVRILMITKDVSVLEKGSLMYQRISGEREVFFEIHVIVLAPASTKEKIVEEGVFRPFENVWVYQVSSASWWQRMYEGYRVAMNQLVFSGGFRADIVIADDLFEAGLVGWYVARKHRRPFQLHIHDDFFDDGFIEEQEHPLLYRVVVWHLLRSAQSVRTRTEFQRQEVIGRRSELEPYTEILPTYYNLKVWKDLPPAFSLHERYPKFKFIILHISAMRPASHSLEALIGVSTILKRYPTLGLVIVGNGPMRADLERQAIALGVQAQVEFEPMPAETISHLKTANVFVHLSEDSAEEDLILEAAVCKIPLIASSTGLAGQLFVDEESAYLCNPSDIRCIGQSLNRYLNQNQERSSFSLNASDVVFDRIEQDYGVYLESYRDSVERSMVGPG